MILVHHRGAARRCCTQLFDDSLHRRLPALQFAAVEQQLADADIAAAVLRVVADAPDVAARQPQAARPLNLEEEEFGGIGGQGYFEPGHTDGAAPELRAVKQADASDGPEATPTLRHPGAGQSE